MYLKFIYKPYLVYVPEIQNWLIDLQFWLTEVNHAKISHILLTSYIYLVSALPGYIDLFWLQNYCFWFTCQVFFFLNCAFKDLHSKRGEMEKKQAAVSIRIVNLWECGATKLMKGDCSRCHYSVLFDDRYSTIYASLTVASWYQNFEKKLLNNWEKKIILFFKWLHHLTTYFLIPQPILVTANCMLGPFSLPQVSDVAHGALVFKLILIRL